MGGWTYGPRILADLTPILALLLYPLKDLLKRSRGLTAVFIIFAVWSTPPIQSEPFWTMAVGTLVLMSIGFPNVCGLGRTTNS